MAAVGKAGSKYGDRPLHHSDATGVSGEPPKKGGEVVLNAEEVTAWLRARSA